MRLHQIGQFYGERKGWRMFDSQFLTPEVADYLQDEEDVVKEAMERGYRRLVEVGCGYGRYLNWAVSRGYDYLGLDIVPWMVQMGQLRVGNARKNHAETKCKIVLHPAENIAGIPEIASSLEKRTLVFFPFNCLGNVSQFEAALDSLKNSKADVVVSTFKTDGTATKIRKAYYQNCGYGQLNSRLMKEGLLIVSEEGFHAMAYYFNWLMNAFKKRGFELAATCESGAVGSIYYFEHRELDSSLNTTAETGTESAPISDLMIETKIVRSELPSGESASNEVASGSNHVILFILEEARYTETASAQLHKFREVTANLKRVETDLLEGTCSESLQVGSIARLIVPMASNESVAEVADVVGEVLVCAPGEGQDYVLSLRLRLTN